MTPPPILWHYTTWEGLDGIRRSGEFWLSKIAYMNDSKELAYAAELMTKQFPGPLSTTGDRPCFMRDVGYARVRFEQVTQPPAPCLGSFSTDKDSLTQWRAYGGSGPSFAIGFDTEALARNAAEYEARWEQCIYDEADQLALLEPALAKIRQAWPGREPAELSHERRVAVETAVGAGWDDFARVAPKLKHPAFTSEQEWRLVTPSFWPGAKFAWGVHRSGNMIVPHLPVSLQHDERRLGAISEIVVGPHAHIELTRTALAHLHGEDFRRIKIDRTWTPFRNW